MEEIALIVVSHGGFAAGAMQSAEMIMGPQTNCRVVSLTQDQGREDVLERLEKALEELDTSRGALILADMKGGTPSNAVGALVLQREDIQAYCGFNLPILLEVLGSRNRELPELRQSIRASFEHSFVDLNLLLRGGETQYGD